MIQDILPYKFDNRYTDARPDSESFLVFVQEESVLLKDMGPSIVLPQFGQFPDCGLDTTYLFSASGHKFFLADERHTEGNTPAEPASVTALLKDGYQFNSISTLITFLKAHNMPYGVNCENGLTTFWFECEWTPEP